MRSRTPPRIQSRAPGPGAHPSGTPLALDLHWSEAWSQQLPAPVRVTLNYQLLLLVLALAACDRAAPERVDASATLANSVEGIAPHVLSSLPAGITPETLREGQQLFRTCSVCHGSDAAGTALAPSLRDSSWIHISGTTEEVVEVTRSGIQSPSEFPIPMPPMGGGAFDERELHAIAAYLEALGRS